MTATDAPSLDACARGNHICIKGDDSCPCGGVTFKLELRYAMTEQEANERCALLLGYEREDDYWLKRSTGGPDWYRPYAPDFSQWDRFPELQEYVRGLNDTGQTRRILELITDDMAKGVEWIYVTPDQVRDAILAVVGEEAEVAVSLHPLTDERVASWLASDESARVRSLIREIVMPVSAADHNRVAKLLALIAREREDAYEEGFAEAY